MVALLLMTPVAPRSACAGADMHVTTISPTRDSKASCNGFNKRECTMKFPHALIALGVMAATQTASAANRPSGWTTICSENQTCTVAANTNVAFGRADQFIYKVLSGSFVCSSATFGSKIAGGV